MTHSKDSDDDKELFKAAMQGVTPLKSSDKINIKLQPKSRIPKRIIQPELIDDIFSDNLIENVTGMQSLKFARSGIQAKVMQDLRRGKIKHSALLDLHGKTIEEARKTLQLFLQHCLFKRCRCVLIIHGKGAKDKPPPIKNHINTWLQQSPDVLAYCSALPRDGGTGAVYVLLRRPRDLA